MCILMCSYICIYIYIHTYREFVLIFVGVQQLQVRSGRSTDNDTDSQSEKQLEQSASGNLLQFAITVKQLNLPRLIPYPTFPGLVSIASPKVRQKTA